MAIPLSPAFPASELKYIIENSQTSLVLTSPKFEDLVQSVSKSEDAGATFHRLKKLTEEVAADENQQISFENNAANGLGLMLYTSGTTSRPKGVVLPSTALTAQINSLKEAWRYGPEDRLLHVLPLHHIHGMLNGLLTPLMAGSSVEFLFPFNTDNVWTRLAAPFQKDASQKEEVRPISIFTAVPTIYNRLLSDHASLPESTQEASRTAISKQNLRLNMCGSAALPSPTKQAWSDLSHGNSLLERYGMTEIGMALSCGIPNSDRVDNSVGWALPGVEIRLADPDTNEPIKENSDSDEPLPGEIQISGPTVFQEYWQNDKATKESFVQSNDKTWFKTGDIAIMKLVSGAGESGAEWASGPMFFIQGRSSVDIIKTGGEKVSALEVERELLSL
jgi:acyl-CoA synthetase (AMP-forming)/AMP-acid ligase II